MVSIGGAGAPEFGKSGPRPAALQRVPGHAHRGRPWPQSPQDQGCEAPVPLSDTSIEYSKSCATCSSRLDQAGRRRQIAGKDTFLNSDPSIANQVSAITGRRRRRRRAVLLPAGRRQRHPPDAHGRHRPADPRGGGLRRHVLAEAIPDLSDFYYPAMVSSAGDDPSADVNEFLGGDQARGRRPSTPFRLRDHRDHQVAVEKAGTTDGAALAAAIEAFTDEPLLVGPTTYTADCHIPLGRPMAMMQIQAGARSRVRHAEGSRHDLLRPAGGRIRWPASAPRPCDRALRRGRRPPGAGSAGTARSSTGSRHFEGVRAVDGVDLELPGRDPRA